MAVVKFSKQTIEPNPLEVDYWVDITSDPYGSVWKYYNGTDWVSLNLNDGSDDGLSSFDYYTKEQVNSLLSGKADVDSVESKVDDAEFANVIQNIEFREIGDNQMEMVLLKYDNATVGVTIPMASETNPGMLSGESFRDFVKQSQLQSLYDELYQIMSDLSLAEKERNDAELLRKTNEDARISAETNRFNAESTRQSEEANRATNENNRVTAENNRNTAEQLRAQAEGNRESTFNTLKGQMQTTIQEGQTAVVATEKATSDAQKVVDNYDAKVAEQDGKLTELGSEVNGINSRIRENNSGEFVIADENGNVILKVDKNGVNTTNYNTPFWKTVDNGINEFVIADENGNVVFRAGYKGVNFPNRDNSSVTAYTNFIKNKYNKSAISWIDDDFLVYENDNSTLRPIYSKVYDFCINNNIRYDFACIPFADATKMALAKKWEEEGFNFLMHPQHDGWYNGYGNIHDIAKARKSLIECIRFFEENFISKRNILVYPGSSNSYDDIVDVIRRYVESAITASEIGSNNGIDNDKFQLKRMSIYISEGRSKTKIKDNIRKAVENGEWIILYTHLYNHEDTEVVDETTNSLANLMEIVSYANSLCKIRPTEEIWRERKIMYDLI